MEGALFQSLAVPLSSQIACVGAPVITCPTCGGAGHVRPRGADPVRIRERFDAKWLPDTHFGCWIWTASLNSNGYGMLSAGSRVDGTKGPRQAHRVGFEIYRGGIPAGMVLDHLCRQRHCVNPWHLEPVTPRENTLRGDFTKRSMEAIAARTHCPRGHPYAGPNLYKRPDGSRGCKACIAAAGRRYKMRAVLATLKAVGQGEA